MSQPLPTPQGLQQASESVLIIKEVLKGLPVIAVMWYMLKDLKTTVTGIKEGMREMRDEIVTLKIDTAANSSPLKIKHLEERLKEDREESRRYNEEMKNQICLINSQLTSIWKKVGDRPEDVRRRLKGE